MRSSSRLLAPALLRAALLVAGLGRAAAGPGSLDPRFGKGGKVVTKVGLGSDAQALALQRDGKIVIAGWDVYTGSNDEFALARYTRRGTLDSSFGKGGIVRTRVGLSSGAYAVTIQKDGKIVAAGWTFDGATSNFALTRYRRNGSLDPTFGNGGRASVPSGIAVALAVQPDGKILAGGGRDRDFAVVRYRHDGTLDPGFGAGGIVSTPVALSSSHINALTVQSDGKIVAAGSASGHEVSEMAFARYNPDGSLDTSFGSGGTATMLYQALSDNFAAAVRMQGKRILAAGAFGSYVALLRLRPNGSLDPSFGERSDGTTLNPQGAWATSLAVQSDGRIVLAGGRVEGAKLNFAVARYSREGYLDSSFGPDGWVTARLSTGQDVAHAVTVEGDGRIVAAGAANEYQPGGGFGVVRYLVAYTCRVPDVRGRALAAARRAIRHGHCSVGGVTRAFSDRVGMGRVISQRPAPRTAHPEYTKVFLVVSKGPRL